MLRKQNENNNLNKSSSVTTSLDVKDSKTVDKSSEDLKEENKDKEDAKWPTDSTTMQKSPQNEDTDKYNKKVRGKNKSKEDNSPTYSMDVLKNRRIRSLEKSGKDVKDDSGEDSESSESSTDTYKYKDNKNVNKTDEKAAGTSLDASKLENNKDVTKNRNLSEEESRKVDSENIKRISSVKSEPVRIVSAAKVESTLSKSLDSGKKEQRSTSLSGKDRGLLPCSSCEFPDPFAVVSASRFNLFKAWTKSPTKIPEFWLISIPKEDHTFSDLSNRTVKLSLNYKFHIPVLKHGSLDYLLSVSDQLTALDGFVREVSMRLCEHIKTELEDKDPSFLEDNLQVRNLNPAIFITRFKWNAAKYSTRFRIGKLADYIFTRVRAIEKVFDEKVKELEETRSKIRTYENRDQANLLQRYLGDIIKEEHLVQDSKYLTTLFVVVSKEREKQWLKSYETLCDLVLPRSSSKIFEDGTHCLFNVTVCSKKVEEFKSNALQKAFVVRDFEYSEEAKQAEEKYFNDLRKKARRLQVSVFVWTKVNFSESFEAWIHVMALRVFAESVVRYGLPVNYQAILLLPLKSRTKLKKKLSELYSDIEGRLGREKITDIPTTLAVFNVEKYLPYVYFDINIDFLYPKK